MCLRKKFTWILKYISKQFRKQFEWKKKGKKKKPKKKQTIGEYKNFLIINLQILIKQINIFSFWMLKTGWVTK